MKSKKRHHTSSEESEDSEGSVASSSSSDSESEDSSVSEHRHKKKRKRANSSESESDSDGQKRSKKRKHKKKKKKHGKKKRRSDSVQSVSVEEISISEGEVSPKKKRKHKHKHGRRDRSSSVSQSEVEERVERRLHSVVKERRASQESLHSRTYYQREYRQSESGEEHYDREREVQRFYKGSSKERSVTQSSEHHQYDRDRHEKYASYPDKYYKSKYGQNAQYSNEDFSRRQKLYDDYRRHPRYEERRPQQEEYHSRQREEQYQPRHDTRGYNQYNRPNQFEGGYKRREYEDGRDYRDRRAPLEHGHYKERQYPDKRYQETAPVERPQPLLRERIAPPPAVYSRDKPASHTTSTTHRDHSRSVSESDRYREQRRPERDDRYRDGRGDARQDPRREETNHREERKDGREDRRDSREKRDSQEEKRDSRSQRRDGRGDEQSDERSGHRRVERKPERAPVNSETKPREKKSRFGPDDTKEYSWGKTEVKKENDTSGDKEKPNFGLSGKLTEDANMVNGVVIKYTQPDDAKQPKRRWRFYPFKGDKALPILYIHRQSAFLIGRDKKVVDIILEHPSISKQHAALQYRATAFTRPDGSTGRRVRPYIIDLDSANGTFVNNKKIEGRRYVELLERDVVKFGFSQREYVLLHENSKDDAQDDDNQELGANVTTTDQIKIEKRAKEEVAEDGE